MKCSRKIYINIVVIEISVKIQNHQNIPNVLELSPAITASTSTPLAVFDALAETTEEAAQVRGGCTGAGASVGA